ncbi:MAG: sugar phosphate isomerase/epimerase family protein [bacterium]
MRVPVNYSRREFLQLSSALLVTAAGPANLFAESGGAPAAKIRVSCRDAHLRETGAPDCWAAMKQIGITAVEVVVNEDLACPALFHPQKMYNIGSPEAIKALQDDLQANGFAITAFMMANRFEERLEKELEWCNKVVNGAKLLDARAIRIDVVPRQLPGDEFLKFAISLGQKLVKMTEGSDVRFAIENHGNTTNRPEFLDPLFEGVGSPNLGLTLDTANFYWFGHPLDQLYGIYEKYASRVFHTHCKSIRYPEDQRNVRRPIGWEYGQYACPVFEGDIDFGRVADILKKAGYQNDFCIEDESLGKYPESERGNILKKEVEHLSRFV